MADDDEITVLAFKRELLISILAERKKLLKKK